MSERIKRDFSYSVEFLETELLGCEDNKEVYDDVINIDFDKSSKEIDKYDYMIAASSGVLTALMDILWVKGLDIRRAADEGSEAAAKFVIAVAEHNSGKTFKDLEAAIVYLEKTYSMASDKKKDDFGGGKYHHLYDFTHHPTIIGLILSIYSQVKGVAIGTDKTGSIKFEELEEGRGKNIAEQIFRGTVQWAFHLISDMAGSSSNPGEGAGIPGPLLATFKELASLKIFHNRKVIYRKPNRKEEEISVSALISKLFTGTFFVEYDENGRILKDTALKFDLRAELGIALQMGRQSIPVIGNECIVRGLYFVRRLCMELAKSNAAEDYTPDWRNVIPFRNRTVARMCTVSSGIFMSIVTAKAAVKALSAAKDDKGSKPNKGNFARAFLLNINYPGTIRFVFACKTELSYFTEDMIYAYRKRLYEIADNESEWLSQAEVFKSFVLDEKQSEILMSVQYDVVSYDISCTRNRKKKELKIKWLNEWKEHIPISIIDNRNSLYSEISDITDSYDDDRWLLLLVMELAEYTPYYPLNIFEDDDKEYQKLSIDSDYFKDVFCICIDSLDTDIFRQAVREFKKTEVALTGKSTAKKAATAIGIIAAGAATGGAAYAFAPGIAVILAGEAVAGLSGAALTSASLAFVGGGALAAGGLGMAGGTAIIAGGGALLGIAGSGAAATINSIGDISKSDISAASCAKLITCCKMILAEQNSDYVSVEMIQNKLEEDVESMVEVLEKTKESRKKIEDKEQKKILDRQIKAGENTVKLIKRSIVYISRILKYRDDESIYDDRFDELIGLE